MAIKTELRIPDFDERTHEYYWQGRKVPSFSQILSEVATCETKKMVDPFEDDKTITDKSPWKSISGSEFLSGREDMQVYSDFGTAFHEAIKIETVYKEQAEFDEALKPYMEQWRQFRKDFVCTPIRHGTKDMVEVPLYSKLHGFAGTPDFIGVGADSSLWILDWKTTTTWAQRKKFRMQAAAYAELYCTSLKKRPKKRFRAKIIRFTEGRPTQYEVEDIGYQALTSEWYKFQSILTTWKIGRGII